MFLYTFKCVQNMYMHVFMFLYVQHTSTMYMYMYMNSALVHVHALIMYLPNIICKNMYNITERSKNSTTRVSG